ncbi:MAG TPA: D-glycero-beta-D-manno-heptose 1,7-bisphosphate 7-phosphatase [Woeseiaceae bacterium]
MATRLIVLDRDGVINRDSDAFIKTPDEWLPLEGSLEAINLLSSNGFVVAVASNQSGLGRGLFDRPALRRIHRKMRRAVHKAGGSIDRIVCCPHAPADACDCRKPAPGLLLRLAHHYGVSLKGVPVVGDAERDLLAAEAVGARPILVLSGKGQSTLAARGQCGTRVEHYADLLSAAKALLREQNRKDA